MVSEERKKIKKRKSKSKSKSKSKKEVDDLRHLLRNNLNAINGYISLLKMSNHKTADKYYELIDMEVQKMVNNIDEIK